MTEVIKAALAATTIGSLEAEMHTIDHQIDETFTRIYNLRNQIIDAQNLICALEFDFRDKALQHQQLLQLQTEEFHRQHEFGETIIHDPIDTADLFIEPVSDDEFHRSIEIAGA